MARVFISHSSADKAHVDAIRNSLKKLGLLDANDEIVDPARAFKPGANVREMLRNAIESANKVIIVWTGGDTGSPYIGYEIGMAEALGKPVIVARRKDASPPLPAGLSHMQFVEFPNDI